MKNSKERGSTLVIAMMMLLVMLGLAVSMTFTAQSQANLASSVKLQQFYETASLNVFNKARASLSDKWNDVDSVATPDDDFKWRFGELLTEANAVTDLTHGNFPQTDGLDFTMEMNSGMLELSYKIWVYNNPDDPAVLLQGFDLDVDPDTERYITPQWDMDGKIVLTIEVFSPLDTAVPIVTQSALLGPVGGEYGYIHDDAVWEGDKDDAGNQGRGSVGAGSSVSITELDDVAP